MGKSKIEKRGRVLIPKKIRDKAGLHGGESVEINMKDDGIMIKPLKSLDELKELKGCVKESKIDPLDLRKMWEM